MVTKRSGVVALVLSSCLALVACGAGSEAEGEVVGFDGSARPVDTSPFEMLGPGEDSPTTLPETFFTTTTTILGVAPTTTSTTSPPAPTTSTTTIPDRPVEVDPAAVRDLCGFTDLVLSFQSLGNLDRAEVEPEVTALVRALAAYRTVASGSVQADLVSIEATVIDLRRLLELNGWDPGSRGFTEAVASYAADPTASDSFAIRLDRVAQAEAASCR